MRRRVDYQWRSIAHDRNIGPADKNHIVGLEQIGAPLQTDIVVGRYFGRNCISNGRNQPIMHVYARQSTALGVRGTGPCPEMEFS